MKQIRVVPSNRRNRMTRVVDTVKKIRDEMLRYRVLSDDEDRYGKKEELKDKLRSDGTKPDFKAKKQERMRQRDVRRLAKFGQRLLESLRPMPGPVTV